MQLPGFNFAFAVYLLAIIAVAIASPAQGGLRSKREDHCPKSKLVINPNNEATSVKIVTTNDETLFSIDSTNTKMQDINSLLTFTILQFFPEEEQVGYNSDYTVIKRPLDNGIELSIIDHVNNTLFNKTMKGSNEGLSKPDVKCTHLTGFRVVVKHDLDVNHVDGYNMTALIWATLLGQNDVAKNLVDMGADVNQVGSYGVHSLITALVPGKEDMVEYLIKHGAQVNGEFGLEKVSPLHVAASKGWLECTNILFKYGARVSSLDANDRTPLHYAALRGHTRLVKLLVEKGAGVNAKSKDGITPLLPAVAREDKEMIDFLIRSGADVNSKITNDVTPLMMAITDGTSDDSSLAIVKLLVEHSKPDLNAKDKDGKTAMSLAASRGFKQVQAYLQAHGAQ